MLGYQSTGVMLSLITSSGSIKWTYKFSPISYNSCTLANEVFSSYHYVMVGCGGAGQAKTYGRILGRDNTSDPGIFYDFSSNGKTWIDNTL